MHSLLNSVLDCTIFILRKVYMKICLTNLNKINEGLMIGVDVNSQS